MISLYLMDEYLYLGTFHIVCMHPSVYGYYSGFQILAAVNTAAMDAVLLVSFPISLSRYTSTLISRSYGLSGLKFL